MPPEMKRCTQMSLNFGGASKVLHLQLKRAKKGSITEDSFSSF